LQKDDLYYLFVKNENSAPAEKNLRLTKNTKPYDFPIEVSAPITGNYWAEGPTPLQIGDYVYVYFDKYTQGKYGAIRSRDMETWEDVSDSGSFPRGIRHGTAFKVDAQVVEKLK
jgi:beta-galactosidase